MGERSLVSFFISKLAERASLDNFELISVAHLAYNSWDNLRISIEGGGGKAELRYTGHLIIRLGGFSSRILLGHQLFSWFDFLLPPPFE